ncbi:MAG: thermonuclease family protein [Nocardioidaceae bacterium]
MSTRPSTSPRKPNWFVRHKVLTAVAVLLLVGWALDINQTETDPQETSGSPASETSAGPVSREKSEPTGRADPESETENSEETGEAPASGDAEPVEKHAAPPAPKPVKRKPRAYLVTRVVDGDTVELANGEDVRIVGIDTPERGECGYDEATAKMERLVLGQRVRLTRSDEDRDRYNRLLRYVDVGRRDAGLAQIEAGLAIARYDSRDGYGYHPRENRYIAADKATPQKCAEPKPAPVKQPAPNAGASCAQGYSPCVPPFPPDVDCADVNGPVQVTGPDPHGLDADGDGWACES